MIINRKLLPHAIYLSGFTTVVQMTGHDNEIGFWFCVHVGSQKPLEMSLSLKAMYKVDTTIEALLAQVSSHDRFPFSNEISVEWC